MEMVVKVKAYRVSVCSEEYETMRVSTQRLRWARGSLACSVRRNNTPPVRW